MELNEQYYEARNSCSILSHGFLRVAMILKIKANEMNYFSNLFLIKNSTCFGQIYRPSSGVSTLYTHQ
jgi:hypothetical protein